MTKILEHNQLQNLITSAAINQESYLVLKDLEEECGERIFLSRMTRYNTFPVTRCCGLNNRYYSVVNFKHEHNNLWAQYRTRECYSGVNSYCCSILTPRVNYNYTAIMEINEF